MLKHFLSPKSIFTFFVKFGIIVSFFFICPQFSFFSCFQLSRLQLIKKETLTLVFSCEFCEFFKNMFIIEQFWWLLLCPVFCSKCIETSIKRKWKHWHEGVSEQKVFTQGLLNLNLLSLTFNYKQCQVITEQTKTGFDFLIISMKCL